MKTPRAIFLAGAALVTAALAAYHNTFAVPLLFDDLPSITDNPSIRQLWPPWHALSPPRGWGFTVSGRPVLNFSLALNQAISGTDVWSYHAFNLLIHALAGLTLFGLARRTLARPVLAKTFGDLAGPAAFAIALLWTLHPLQTEAVTYIIQRAESLMGLFFLLTLYAFVRSVDSPRPKVWQALSVVACALGMGCKEVMVTAPAVVLLFDRTFVAGNFGETWRRRRWYYAALAATWLPLGWLVASTGGNRGGTFDFTVAGFGGYWLTQFGALTRYLSLAVWPASLAFEYGRIKVAHWPEVVPAALFVGGLAGATLWALWRRPVAGFLGACFFVILSPTSLVPGTTQIVVEHRMYLPLAAVIALLAGGLAARFGRRGVAALLLLALGAGVLTVRRNADYESDLTLWRDTVQKRPGSSWAQGNLATALFNRGAVQEALPHYVEALRLDPDSAQTHYNLGLALEQMGRTEEAGVQYATAVRILPYFAQANARLGALLIKRHRSAEAVAPLTIAAEYRPDLPEVQNNLGLALAETGRFAEAVGHDEAALKLSPRYADAECNLGAALFRLNRLPEAERHLGRALQLQPEFAEAHYNLGLVAAAAGRPDEALAQYAAAVRIDATHGEARLNLGIALAQAGRLPEALTQLQEAARLRPELAEAHANLGIVLAEAGRPEEAVTAYEAALRLRPDYAMAHYNLGNALVQLRRWAEARAQFAEAVRLAPDFSGAREMLERLQSAP